MKIFKQEKDSSVPSHTGLYKVVGIDSLSVDSLCRDDTDTPI